MRGSPAEKAIGAPGDHAARFPRLARHTAVLPRVLPWICWAFVFIGIGGGLVDAFWPPPPRAPRTWVRFWFQYGPTLGIFGCVALMFVAGWRGKGYLESKGYGRLASGSIRFQLGLVVRRRLIERLPRFEEIEHTPYNNPNDPAALHRILDDLAAQMEEDGPKRPETGLSRL